LFNLFPKNETTEDLRLNGVVNSIYTKDPSTNTNIITHKRIGDRNVAFNCEGNCGALGKKIFGMATNPAPLPIYTLDNQTAEVDQNSSSWKSFETRVIKLNGISITILEENFEPQNYGNGAVKVKVKWDDYNIDQDTRYCGEIELLPHQFDNSLPSMVLLNGKQLNIDRGKSPTRQYNPFDYKTEPNSPNLKLFTDSTVLTLKPNSKIEMQAASNLIIENGSKLKLNNAAEINMLANAHIEVKSNGILDLEAGSLIKLAENATILVHDGGKIIIRDGATLMLQKNSQLLIEQDGVWGQGELVIENTQTDFGMSLGDVNDGPNNTECRINGKLTLKNGANFTYKGSGYYTFGEYFNTNFEDPASKVNLVGLSQNNLLIKIECAEIDFRNHDVNIDKGLLSYQNTGLMQIENSNFYLDRLKLEGNGDAEVFNAFKPKNFVMNRCIGNNFNFIGKIANAQPNAYLTVGSCTFEDCKSGFSVESCGYFNFATLTMKKTVSNCIELNNTGKVICIFVNLLIIPSTPQA